MNLLVVDDHPTNRKLLRLTLEAESHATLEACDGIEALEVLARENVDAIISDILMPKMDGFRLCHEVRKNERLRALPFIIYTSTYTSPDDKKLAENVGADKYLTKPAPAAAVLKALHEAIAVRASRSAESAPALAENHLLEQHNQTLANKLEKKHAELQPALVGLQEAHDHILKLNRDLERRVQERTAELAQANEKLRRKNDEIQNCFHTLSHELKTPLTSAREFISIVMDGLAGPANKLQLEYLGNAKESCDQLTVCVNDLIDATRLETGKLAIHLQNASLGDLAQRVVTGLRSVGLAEKISMNLEVQPGLPEIPFDETRTTQIISNLLHNAARFTPEGGSIGITVTEAPGRPEFLQIAVTDNGQGIAKDRQVQIFDRLYQIKEGDAATGKGIGLGLYICRELVLLHGGEIWVESEPGKGSTFKFTLPLKSKGKSSAPPVADDEVVGGQLDKKFEPGFMKRRQSLPTGSLGVNIKASKIKN